MASGPSGPPIPPSGNSDKGKGKKSYVVKLMTRFNNEIGSTSQPTTPTSTSIGRSVPPPLVVPAFNPTPHQVPTSTPTSIGTSLPPPIQVPGLTPTPYQVPPHRMASLSPNVGSNPSTPKNIAPSPGIEDADPHSSSVVNYVEECSNSCPMITPVGGGRVSWKPEDDEKSQEPGRSVHVDEIFQQTHIRQSTGEFVDERSRRTHEQFVAKFSQIRSETASVGVSTSSPLDPAEEERLRNRCWLEAAGGKYKGRVYDIGNVTSQDDCVDSYIQQTQASSTAQPQNSEEIVNLKSQLQQYGQQLQNFEGFIGVLLPFLPPSAAAAAQEFLNLQNPQVQNEGKSKIKSSMKQPLELHKVSFPSNNQQISPEKSRGPIEMDVIEDSSETSSFQQSSFYSENVANMYDQSNIG
ncbi:hypothetical protein LR48_Vigan04g141800 [Vigna angularis]|uniref:Uncharacterized protein n=1 Tax=Phaseolus angularis TaxID=3914 RepID=A0A0L9UE57_PHAAN|nr:hypothetical protein LR48_Vigan04g141800 [Vigna angularis]